MRSIKMGTALLFFSLLLSVGLTSDFICSEGTQKYCINISQHYCTHWEPIHALREVLQNWVDALRDRFPGKKIQVRRIAQESVGITNFYPVIEGTKNEHYYISYNRYEKKLVLVNEGAFKVENMLLGASTKMGNKRALGQFGEGMKLYLLVLLKHSHYVYIQSGDYYYGAVLEKQCMDKGLSFYISPRTIKKDNTRVVIGNVTETLFTSFTNLSLLNSLNFFLHSQKYISKEQNFTEMDNNMNQTNEQRKRQSQVNKNLFLTEILQYLPPLFVLFVVILLIFLVAFLLIKKKMNERNNIDLGLRRCPICLQLIIAESQVFLKCNHYFHHFCLNNWKERQNNCPLCRKQIQIYVR